jgi:hypothetical protein
MSECLQLHFDLARTSFKRSLLLCLGIAVAGSIAIAIAGESVLFFPFGLVVVSGEHTIQGLRNGHIGGEGGDDVEVSACDRGAIVEGWG